MKLIALTESHRHIIQTFGTTIDPLTYNKQIEMHDEDIWENETEPIAYIIRLSDGSNAYLRYTYTSPITLELLDTIWIDTNGEKFKFKNGIHLGIALFGIDRGTNWGVVPSHKKLQPFTDANFDEFNKALLKPTDHLITQSPFPKTPTK